MNSFSRAFTDSLNLPPLLDPGLDGALRHVLRNPGSLVRPRLIYQMATAYGLGSNQGEQLAVALEYFHTASLLFDDLPCMDDALERRGAPCTHRLYGEEGAILAALALINRAYALLWRAMLGCPSARQLEAMTFVEECLGVEGLLNGQSLDLHFSSLPKTRETTEHIARGKTVSLVRLTLVLPAILGGATVRELQLIERISAFWGLSYQMVDDLKDLLQGAEQSGKTSARDTLLGRPNVAAVIGVPAAVQRLNRFIALGDRALRQLITRMPRLSFLETLRAQLEGELERVLDSTCALAGAAEP